MKKIVKFQTYRLGIAERLCSGDFSDNIVKNLCFYVAFYCEDENNLSIYNEKMGNKFYKNLDLKLSFTKSILLLDQAKLNKTFLNNLVLSLIDKDFDSLFNYNKNCEKYGYITYENSNIKNYTPSVYGLFSETEYEDKFYYDEIKNLYILNDHIFENLDQIYGHLDERESFVIGVRANSITNPLIF